MKINEHNSLPFDGIFVYFAFIAKYFCHEKKIQTHCAVDIQCETCTLYIKILKYMSIEVVIRERHLKFYGGWSINIFHIHKTMDQYSHLGRGAKFLRVVFINCRYYVVFLHFFYVGTFFLSY